MNRGNVGFLMNEFSEKGLVKRLEEAISYKLHPLKSNVTIKKIILQKA